MDDIRVKLKTFLRISQESNAERRSIFDDFMEALKTFIEEIILSGHIKISATDTIDVKELLYQDFLDFCKQLQPDLTERMDCFLKRLQESKEDRLRNIHKRIQMLQSGHQVDEKQILSKEMKDEEKRDIAEFLFLTNSIIETITGLDSSDSVMGDVMQKMREHRGTFDFSDEVFRVDVINKRNIGKMIIRFVGHEGVQRKQNLRRLLQCCIDHLQTKPESTWKNASITLYDDSDIYKIVSGKEKHGFICRMKDGEPVIKEKIGSLPANSKTAPPGVSLLQNDESKPGCTVT